MPVENSLSFKGLVTSPNNLGAGSEGALVVANNVTIRYPDVLEPRRGQEGVPVVGIVSPWIMSAVYYRNDRYGITTVDSLTLIEGDEVYISVGNEGTPFKITISEVISINQYVAISPKGPADAGQTAPQFLSAYNRMYRTSSLISFPTSQVAFFQDKVLLHSETLDKIKFADATTPLFGDYSAANPDYRLKTAVSASTLYMATDKGVMALEQASDFMPRMSGILEIPLIGLEEVADSTVTPPTIPGFLLPGKAVAYRVLFGYVDSNKAVHLGPPSARFTIRNNSTTVNESVKVVVPLWTAPAYANGDFVEGSFVRVYRSVMADTEAQTSDELYLVNETVISPSYSRTSLIEIADNTRQEFAVQSAPLYTNATQGGLPNDPPPFARDLANWDSRLWYANTEQPYSLTAQLIGVKGGGSPNLPATGLRRGDTITVDGVTFRASDTTSATSSPPRFRVTDNQSADRNISDTIEELAEVVCSYANLVFSNFNILAYIEPVVFGNEQRYFKIRFARYTVSLETAINTPFSVEYAVQQRGISNVSAPSSGNQTITTASGSEALNIFVDDYVFVSTSSYSNTTPFRVVAVSGNLVTVASGGAIPVGVPGAGSVIFRAYGESVWTPDLSAIVEAENERRENGLYYSLPGEPEAVSTANYLTVGTSGRAIQRIVPQRDRLLVFKEEGTYAVYGDFPYQVSLIDDTVQILAPDSAVALGSTVFVLTDDGILAITDGGIQMISKVIDSTLKPYLASTGRNTTATGAFGVSYESEKVFALYMPALGVTGYEAKAYVYGLESGAWTTWTFDQPRTCGRVDPFTDTAYYGTTATPYLFKDKNTSSTADYVDGSTSFIVSTVQWAATTLGAPYATKQARELHLHYRDLREASIGTLLTTYSIKTDIVRDGQTVDAWSSADTFSTEPTIGVSVLPYQFRKLIPQNVQRATYYTLGFEARTALGYWALNGYSIVYEGTSERTGTVR